MFFFYSISHSFITLGIEHNSQLQLSNPISLQYMPWREQYQQKRANQTEHIETQKKQCVFCRIPEENKKSRLIFDQPALLFT